MESHTSSDPDAGNRVIGVGVVSWRRDWRGEVRKEGELPSGAEWSSISNQSTQKTRSPLNIQLRDTQTGGVVRGDTMKEAWSRGERLTLKS